MIDRYRAPRWDRSSPTPRPTGSSRPSHRPNRAAAASSAAARHRARGARRRSSSDPRGIPRSGRTTVRTRGRDPREPHSRGRARHRQRQPARVVDEHLHPRHRPRNDIARRITSGRVHINSGTLSTPCRTAASADAPVATRPVPCQPDLGALHLGQWQRGLLRSMRIPHGCDTGYRRKIVRYSAKERQ
jgi:hypothetical protein